MILYRGNALADVRGRGWKENVINTKICVRERRIVISSRSRMKTFWR